MGSIYLLLYMLLVRAANCHADHNSSFDQVLNYHCGNSDCAVDAPNAISANIRLELEGTGFHRRLHYIMNLTGLDESARRPTGAVIIQPLPAAIYANIYELDSDFLAGNGPEVRLFGEVDVESIEKFAQPTTLAIYHPLLSAASTEKKGSNNNNNALRDTVRGVVNISIPLHGRYPRAVLGSNNNKNSGWEDLLEGHLVDIKLPPPLVLWQSAESENSPEKKQWKRAKVEENVKLQKDSIVWSLPAGNLRLQTLTAAITAVVVCAAAAAVVHSILCISDKKQKMV